MEDVVEGVDLPVHLVGSVCEEQFAFGFGFARVAVLDGDVQGQNVVHVDPEGDFGRMRGALQVHFLQLGGEEEQVLEERRLTETLAIDYKGAR